MELQGANALVTGAAGGLGRYICRALAARGANLAVSDLAGEPLEARAAEVAAFGTRVETVPADLAKQRERRPRMLERRRGHIVNIASLAGKAPLAYCHTYNATKFGVVGFSHALRHELTDDPVSVSAICPGFVEREGMYGRVEEQVAPENPLGSSPPEEVGAAVVRAITEDRAEIIINKRPVRPLIALAAVAPKAALWLNERIGTRKAAEEMGKAYGRF